ncbi:MAG: hypothetical protein M3H12_18035 [Chromatiales bacterium]
MLDLVNDLLRRKRKTVGDPNGWHAFAQELGDINLPIELVDNETRKSHIQQVQKTKKYRWVAHDGR